MTTAAIKTEIARLAALPSSDEVENELSCLAEDLAEAERLDRAMSRDERRIAAGAPYAVLADGSKIAL